MTAVDQPAAQPAVSRPSFGQRLTATVAARGRLCVGIDPHPHLLAQWGLPADATGLQQFSDICVEAFGDTVALVKPQVAFYEAYGSAGYAVLEQTLNALHDADALTLADAKRGDIGSTMAAYATAWLADESPLAVDAVTVSPYLGFGALQPAVDLALAQGRGLFVLAATSNPEGPSVQLARTGQPGGDGEAGTAQARAVAPATVAQSIVDHAAAINTCAHISTVAGDEVPEANSHQVSTQSDSSHTLGSIGVVVGATVSNPPNLSQLNGPVLLPGVGAQGGTAEDVARLVPPTAGLAIANVSRSILQHGPDVAALRQAVAEHQALFPLE